MWTMGVGATSDPPSPTPWHVAPHDRVTQAFGRGCRIADERTTACQLLVASLRRSTDEGGKILAGVVALMSSGG